MSAIDDASVSLTQAFDWFTKEDYKSAAHCLHYASGIIEKLEPGDEKARLVKRRGEIKAYLLARLSRACG